MPQLLFTPRKDPVPIVPEAGWAPGLVWTGAENLAPTGIQSPDHPACSQSLYRLSYLAHGTQGLHHYSEDCFSETLALMCCATQHHALKQSHFVIVLIFIQNDACKRRRHYSSLGEIEKVLQHPDIPEHIPL
jgi:hypothetical protein